MNGHGDALPDGHPPALAVVVASHDRPVRLRWLLNALEDQGLDPSRWELIVVHDSADAETDDVLARHPLAARAGVRAIRLPRGATASEKREAGWRASDAGAIVFTHDDCRPAPDWLEQALTHAERHPDAVGIGPVRPHPEETRLMDLSSMIVTTDADATDQWCNAGNVLYPRRVLQELDGFPPGMSFADEVVVRARARAAGTRVLAVDDMLVHHGVRIESLLSRCVRVWTRAEAPRAVAAAPSLRAALRFGVATDDEHLLLIAALAGLVLARRHPATLLLGTPWLHANRRRHNPTLRGLARSLTEAPAAAVTQSVEVLALLRTGLAARRVVV